MKRRDFINQSSTLAGAGYLGLPLIKGQQESYRIVLIGSGWWGMNILREAVRSGKVKLVGLCDVDQNQLKKAAEEVKEWNGQSPTISFPFLSRFICSEMTSTMSLAC